MKPKSIKFTVYGEPAAQGRPRGAISGRGKIVMYDPAKSKEYKQYVSLVASQHRQKSMIEYPVSLTVKVFRPIPASWTKSKQRQAADGTLRPVSKPDLSNYIKGVEDALEGVLLRNDSQVVDYGKSGKWYSDKPRIEIEIEEAIL